MTVLKEEVLNFLLEDDPLDDYCSDVKNAIFSAIADPSQDVVLDIARRFSAVAYRIRQQELKGLELREQLINSGLLV